jgi:hypothetical protein
MTDHRRYAVLQAHPEGHRRAGTFDRLEDAVVMANGDPSYMVYDHERSSFVETLSAGETRRLNEILGRHRG